MNKRIAIPIENGELCAHFGHCQSFALIEVKDNQINDITEVIPPEHQPGLYPRWIAGYDVTDVIAGGMGQKAIHLFNEQNINVFVGAPTKSARDLVNDFINGKLNLQANYCDHGGHQHQHGGCRH
ncbi:MAG: NifB/NifX family molybdenum-iron cluster-binding protein [Bacteroidota bacterium]